MCVCRVLVWFEVCACDCLRARACDCVRARARACGGGGGGRQAEYYGLSVAEVTMQSSVRVGGGIIMGCLPPLCVCEDVS